MCFLKTQFIALFISAAAIFCASHGRAASGEIVLENLAAGCPPDDPLPALRANKPSASDLAAARREHPYLFFTAKERDAMRARASDEPYKMLRARVVALVDECLLEKIPPMPILPDNIPPRLPDGSRNPEWAKIEYNNEFFSQSYLVKKIIPTLGFAYQLTGDKKYAEAGKRWLLDYAARPKLTTPGREADFHMAHVMHALALGYDWLHETMSEGERDTVRNRLAQLSEPMAAAAQEHLRNKDPQRNRNAIGGNHVRRTNGLFALIPLVLLYEEPKAAAWLDAQIQLQRDRLYPSGYAPDGSYMETWDHYKSGMDDPVAFAVALRRMGGEDFYNDPTLKPRFSGMPFYYLYGLEARCPGQSWNKYGWFGLEDDPKSIYAWLAIAGALGDSCAQWIATREGGLKKLDPVFAYLLYDSSVEARAPRDPEGSVYFRYAGMVKLSNGWGGDGIVVPFRCGPNIPKDLGDQNAFRLNAGGEWLAPKLAQAGRAPGQERHFEYDLMGWFIGSPAQNVILPDPEKVPDLTTLQKLNRIPVGGGVQFATGTVGRRASVRDPDGERQKVLFKRQQEWLAGNAGPLTGDLRVVHFGKDFDYVCGEARRSYLFYKQALSLRHVLFVKKPRPYILICDELEGDGQPRAYAWQMHLGAPVVGEGRSLRMLGAKAAMDIHWLLPADGEVKFKESPAPLPKERTWYVQHQANSASGNTVFVTALVPAPDAGAERTPLQFRVLEAAGGWAVEVKGEGDAGADVALFRSERTKRVEAAGAGTAGAAALLRTGADGKSKLFTLGK